MNLCITLFIHLRFFDIFLNIKKCVYLFLIKCHHLYRRCGLMFTVGEIIFFCLEIWNQILIGSLLCFVKPVWVIYNSSKLFYFEIPQALLSNSVQYWSSLSSCSFVNVLLNLLEFFFRNPWNIKRNTLILLSRLYLNLLNE